jgi:transposase InsO family protein
MEEAEAMSKVVPPSREKPYGLARVCRAWEIPRSTVYYQRDAAVSPLPAKRGPTGPMNDEDLVKEIRAVLDASPFHGEGHRKVWARLRFAGIRTSKRRTLRLMRENNLLAPIRVGRPHGPRAHDGTIITAQPDVMWGTDLTTTLTALEGNAHIFIAVDHCTAECIGVHAAKRGNRFEALEPIRQGVTEIFGRFEAGAAKGLAIRHDHGSAYVSDHFQTEIAFFGMTASPAFVQAPEGNGCAERFIRTLKENLLWVRHFDTIEHLRAALLEFKKTYNESWLIERHGFLTPAQAREVFKPSRRAA